MAAAAARLPPPAAPPLGRAVSLSRDQQNALQRLERLRRALPRCVLDFFKDPEQMDAHGALIDVTTSITVDSDDESTGRWEFACTFEDFDTWECAVDVYLGERLCETPEDNCRADFEPIVFCPRAVDLWLEARMCNPVERGPALAAFFFACCVETCDLTTLPRDVFAD